MSTDFVEALEQHDIESIKRIPKGDLHNHAPRGANVRFIEKWAGVQIPRLNHKFIDLDDMQAWYKNNIRCHCQGTEGYEIRIKDADGGVKVTINTDDILIFDVSISQMFLDLYKANVFSASELNEIGKNGLCS